MEGFDIQAVVKTRVVRTVAMEVGTEVDKLAFDFTAKSPMEAASARIGVVAAFMAEASSSTKIATVAMDCSFEAITALGEMLVCSNISLN